MLPKKIVSRLGKVIPWKGNGDLHTSYGMIKEDELNSDKGLVKSNIDKEFLMLNASFMDKLQYITRGPQSMLEKDMAMMIMYTSPKNDAKIVEIGSGSGKFTCVLGYFFPNANIISYDRVEDHNNLARKNTEDFNISNVSFKVSDVIESFDESDVDVVFMDIPDPDKAVSNVASSLKNGGYLVVYVPTIAQVMSFVDKAHESSIIIEKTIELLERPWHVDGKKVRPISSGVMHSAFLVFSRKV